MMLRKGILLEVKTNGHWPEMYQHWRYLITCEINTNIYLNDLYQISCFQSGDLRIIGMYIATNIAQEGNRFPVLHPALFQYTCTGQYMDLPVQDDDIPDPDVKCLLVLVRDT